MDYKKLLKQNISSFDETELKNFQKTLSRNIASASNEDKTLLILKNKQVSELLKLKYPKKKKNNSNNSNKVNRENNRKHTIKCNGCDNNFITSRKALIFCGNCRIKRQKDLIEIITNDNNIKVEIFDHSRITEVEDFLSSQDTSIRLDLHNVVDITSPETKLGNPNDISIVSYVIVYS